MERINNDETTKQSKKGTVYSMAAHIERVDQQQDELWHDAMTTVYETAPVLFRLLSDDFEVSYADVVKVGIRALVREAELYAAGDDDVPGDEGAKEVLQWCRRLMERVTEPMDDESSKGGSQS